MDGIADRGGKYNKTDVVIFELPMRRLLVAGLAGDKALVAVEHGGFGWGVGVTLFVFTDSKAAVERTWRLTETPQTLRELVDRLASAPR